MSEYEVELCRKMLNYCAMSCNKVENKTFSEIRERLEFLFDKEVIEQAIERLTT